MKKSLTLISLACLLFAGCAGSGKPKDDKAAMQPSTPEQAAAAEKKREAKERPPVKVGPDIIVEKEAAQIWPLLIKVEDWGSLITKSTKPSPAPASAPEPSSNGSMKKRASRARSSA